MDPKTHSAFLRLQRHFDPESLNNQKLLEAAFVIADHLSAEVMTLAEKLGLENCSGATLEIWHDRGWRIVLEDKRVRARLTYWDYTRWHHPTIIFTYARETMTLEMVRLLAEWISRWGNHQQWLAEMLKRLDK